MKKTVYIGFILLLCLICVGCLGISATENAVYNWYCVRKKNHEQPVADKNMQFIENYDGYYIDHSHGNESEEKVLYLTFDAGYENGNIAKILDILSEERVTGAFFILGNLINRDPQLVLRMAQDGHTVCNHTNHHPDMTKKKTLEDFQKELVGLEELYTQATGRELSKYYRPPEGRFNQTSLQYAQQLGYKTVFWSLAYADWDNLKQPSCEEAKNKLLSNVHNGAVILLHPTSSTNAAILKEVIQTLKSQGYRFGTLDELTSS